MKYIDEFRRHDLALNLASAIAAEAASSREYRFMEFCGGHTHAIFRYGVQDLMPPNVRFVHGPGCPVCVLPVPRIDNAIELASQPGVILATYADMMRVPATKRTSLIKAKAAGADVRMVYSTQDALKIARDNPEREVVFFAIGFETTTPATAVAMLQARTEGLANFSVFSNHVLTPPALQHLLETEDGADAARVDGFIGPSHVSTVIGSAPYEPFAAEYRRPVVIAGFEPLDVMQATLMLIRQINEGRHEVENQYIRAVTREGNRKAQKLMAEVFELRDTFEWRGLGWVPHSALKLRESFAEHDAEQRFTLTPSETRDVKGCACPAILRGLKEPSDCELFGTVCTPEAPVGACMVSSEGACAAYWSYGRFRSTSTKEEAAA
ncbi:MAG: hydrogenase formation protein HypD [Alphaproteobacteria bacterium]